MGCGDVRLLRTIGGIDFTGQERAALNKLTRISDLAVAPYRQTSRRALISGAPTQGTPPRRVTPCG